MWPAVLERYKADDMPVWNLSPRLGTGDGWMPVRITDACVACGTCAEECPAEAISEGKDVYVIDQEKCTECGNCIEVCPTEAIVKE